MSSTEDEFIPMLTTCYVCEALHPKGKWLKLRIGLTTIYDSSRLVCSEACQDAYARKLGVLPPIAINVIKEMK